MMGSSRVFGGEQIMEDVFAIVSGSIHCRRFLASNTFCLCDVFYLSDCVDL